jgi:hypothetical protein
MTTMNLFATALAAALLAGCDAPIQTTSLESALTHADCDNPNPILFERDSRPFGVSMESWTERWWNWVYSVPFATNPNFRTNQDCNQNQHGPIFFFPTPLVAGPPPPVSCTVPAHQPIGIMMPTVLNDFPCPDPTFAPAPGQTLFDFLLSVTKPIEDEIVQLDATLDGVPLKDLLTYRFTSDDLFSLTGDLSLQVVDNCVTGKPQPAVADSIFVVIKHLGPGQHTLVKRSVTNKGLVTTHTDTLTVLGD